MLTNEDIYSTKLLSQKGKKKKMTFLSKNYAHVKGYKTSKFISTIK